MPNQASPTRSHRDLGRPRTFTDDDAIEATMRVLLRVGAPGLSLAAVARELSCTGQALNARFGSRDGLLSAYIEWAMERNAARFIHVRSTHVSPLASVRARFSMPIEGREEELAGAGSQIQILTLAADVQRVPALAKRYREHAADFERELAGMLQEAVARKELLPAANPAEIAHLLLTSTFGASAVWSVTMEGSLLDEVMRVVDQILAPYLA